jgi:formylglycine-generating enzyme required for sulfatase activity
MIGNLWEWTDEWYAGLGDATTSATPWPPMLPPDAASYGNDGTWNITSKVSGGAGDIAGMPAAALRGGVWNSGTLAGAFALDLGNGPSTWDSYVGARCVLVRP